VPPACGSWSGWPCPCWWRRGPAHSPIDSAKSAHWAPRRVVRAVVF
jgi:hypothetical protein